MLKIEGRNWPSVATNSVMVRCEVLFCHRQTGLQNVILVGNLNQTKLAGDPETFNLGFYATFLFGAAPRPCGLCHNQFRGLEKRASHKSPNIFVVMWV